jgi:hypothetical protein
VQALEAYLVVAQAVSGAAQTVVSSGKSWALQQSQTVVGSPISSVSAVEGSGTSIEHRKSMCRE